ncbi:AtpF F0F1-type ATP synthase, subunit b [Caulobacteraceae bacterium]|jgi:F-type H+-transporting ATPase subunit b|eukprot:gene10322-13870_t
MAGESHAVDAAGKAGEHASGGFPPFDPSLFSSQIFWFWLAFGALYIVLAAVVIPRFAKTLADRKNAIEGDLKAAAEQTAAAQSARQEAEKAQAEARAQARKTVEEARHAHEAAAAKAEAAATKKANTKIAKAEEKISASREAALVSINETVGELAGAIVERVSGIKPTAKALDTAVKSVAGAA